MRTTTLSKALSAAAALALFAGCSSGSAIAPTLRGSQSHARASMGHVPALVGPIGAMKIAYHAISGPGFDACPARGTIVYVSDFNNSVINIYSGRFQGQGPCGKLTKAGGLLNPQGLFVDKQDHLWVANTGNGNVLEFKRGGSSPIATFVDTANGNGEFPSDVTVAKDGTVIATNLYAPNTGIGSISTWNANGNFVGNFPNAASGFDYFITVQKNGTVYWNDSSLKLWVGSCPAGACGAFTDTGATGFNFPGGVRSADGEDVALLDQSGIGGGTLNTYESFPGGPAQSCLLAAGSDTVTFDLNYVRNRVYYSDATLGLAGEAHYPSCAPIGTVSSVLGSLPIGVAVDDPEPL
jgi:DNA-binding beta-propeller fold protein YncE